MKQNTPKKWDLKDAIRGFKRDLVYGGLIALVIVFLVMLSGTVHAVSDCEFCNTVLAITGSCSKELVELYARETNTTIEWICLIDPPISADPITQLYPVTALGMEDGTIKAFSVKSNFFIKISLKDFRAWGLVYDGKSDTATWWITYNTPISVNSEATKVSFKIYSVLPITRNDTKVGVDDVFINFSEGTPISSVTNTPYGMEVNASLISRTGVYNISGTVGKLDACVWSCVDIRDFVLMYGETSNSVGVYLNLTFGYFRGRVDDWYNTCAIDPRASCTVFFKYNGDGAVTTIPTTDTTTKLDCSGTLCYYKATSFTSTWTYRYPKCRNIDSGHIVRTEFDTTGIMSGNRAYSCIENSAPYVVLVSPTNNSDNTTPINFTFYALDNQTGTFTCKLYLNDTLTSTKTGVVNNTNTTFLNINFTAGGNYSWYVNCTDAGYPTLTGQSATWYLNVTVPVPEVTPSPAFIRSSMADYFYLLLFGDRRASEDSATLEDNLLLLEVIGLAGVIGISVLFALASRDYAGLIKRKV